MRAAIYPNAWAQKQMTVNHLNPMFPHHLHDPSKRAEGKTAEMRIDADIWMIDAHVLLGATQSKQKKPFALTRKFEEPFQDCLNTTKIEGVYDMENRCGLLWRLFDTHVRSNHPILERTNSCVFFRRRLEGR